jgi:hypothetical protein
VPLDRADGLGGIHFGDPLRTVFRPVPGGIMHKPTGQSGHPLSPFYASSRPSSVAGNPTPFPPGPTQRYVNISIVETTDPPRARMDAESPSITTAPVDATDDTSTAFAHQNAVVAAVKGTADS